MKNTFGNSVSVTVFGESHGEAIGAVLDGLSSGIDVDCELISSYLAKRRPSSAIDTSRQEKDNFKIISGVFEGKTTGTPICVIIPNEDTKSKDYSKMRSVARPSHADYSAYCKYHGYEDYRGGGHFSGRITAPIVALGAIAQQALNALDIKIATHILTCGNIKDRKFDNIKDDIEKLKKSDFPVLSDCQKEMEKEILNAKEELDSVGGVLETVIYGIPAGVGEPWFDSIESIISHAVFSVGGVKGIEFGAGFSMANMRGSQANDQFCIEDGKVITKTNNNGGINGGISNGMPIVFSCAIKPTPSIAKEQNSVNFIDMKNEKISICGRHDPAIVRRACPVIESVTALALCDMLAQRYGTDVFTRGIKF